MKKLVVLLVGLVITIILSINVYAQSFGYIHLGGAFPLSEFADDDEGGAGIGFNIGAKYQYQITDFGLGIYAGADFIYNGLKSSVKDDIKDTFSSFGIDADIRYSNYINVPLTTGVSYIFKINDGFAISGDLGIGADIFKVTDMKLTADGEEFNISFDLSAKVAYKFGAGLLLKDKYLIEVNYLGTGEHNVEGEMVYNGESQDIAGPEMEINLVTLTFGFKF